MTCFAFREAKIASLLPCSISLGYLLVRLLECGEVAGFLQIKLKLRQHNIARVAKPLEQRPIEPKRDTFILSGEAVADRHVKKDAQRWSLPIRGSSQSRDSTTLPTSLAISSQNNRALYSKRFHSGAGK